MFEFQRSINHQIWKFCTRVQVREVEVSWCMGFVRYIIFLTDSVSLFTSLEMFVIVPMEGSSKGNCETGSVCVCVTAHMCMCMSIQKIKQNAPPLFCTRFGFCSFYLMGLGEGFQTSKQNLGTH